MKKNFCVVVITFNEKDLDLESGKKKKKNKEKPHISSHVGPFNSLGCSWLICQMEDKDLLTGIVKRRSDLDHIKVFGEQQVNLIDLN